jgi:hypothetical protein
MNLDALAIPTTHLLTALQERISQRNEMFNARDAKYGADRVRVTSYMENIGWPELLGFDMNRFYSDPDFSIETQLVQKIFWADNSADDSVIDLSVNASTGMYYDMTLFGQRINHTWDGVPQFEPHPLAQMIHPQPSDLPVWDFATSGDMPRLITQYQRMLELSEQRYAGMLRVNFPHFHRGPLDIYVQMRGFENFVDDAAERPQMVLDFLALFVESRLRFAQERARFLGEDIPYTSFVADDWVNVPFIAPRMFTQFAVPAYRQIEHNEGPVTGFHTCGNIEAVVNELLAVFLHIRLLEVSGWNDVRHLDALVSPSVGFNVQIINTLVLAGSEDEQRARLRDIAQVSQHRRVTVCAQALVKLTSYEDIFQRLNRFITLARDMLACRDNATL